MQFGVVPCGPMMRRTRPATFAGFGVFDKRTEIRRRGLCDRWRRDRAVFLDVKLQRQVTVFMRGMAQLVRNLRRRGKLDILSEIATKHGFAADDLKGAGRTRPISLARQEACYEIMVRTGASYSDVGRLLERDHTTILDGVTRHCKRLNIQRPIRAR